VILVVDLLTKLVMQPLQFPENLRESLSFLKNSSPYVWNQMYDDLKVFGEYLQGPSESPVKVDDILKMMEAGFIAPWHDGMKFKVWTYIAGEYQDVEHMEDDDFDIFTGVLDYFMRVN
jgi:hypothetical protein